MMLFDSGAAGVLVKNWRILLLGFYSPLLKEWRMLIMGFCLQDIFFASQRWMIFFSALNG